MANKPLGIVVLGAAGRMGKTICNLASAEPGFELAGAVDRSDALAGLESLDVPVSHKLEAILNGRRDVVAIDFTSPQATLENLAAATEYDCPVVIGTTGFSEAQKRELEQYAEKIPCLWSANMSIGVNVLMRLLPGLASALGPAYDIEMSEIHHRHKKDAPSGTALMLGEALAKSRGWDLAETRISCRDGLIGARPEKQIGIQAIRGGDVVGIHTVYFLGPGETIELRHQAESRENFGQGALRAAKWLSGQKPGRLYSMQDVIADALSG
ncbi:MAG: 4-hydroxy-tetrahydrodipicolinate reductase [Desulfovibrio sp.]|nr:4-hydroxy-tetrahydrodipicolinate reductase [Desulfovibrio sp.]